MYSISLNSILNGRNRGCPVMGPRKVMGGNPLISSILHMKNDVYVILAMAQATLLQISLLPSDLPEKFCTRKLDK